jgi:DNA-binding NarL/FixJ family response regulator
MKRVPRKKLLLVDDSRVVRQRLQALLADLPDVEVVGNATRVAEAIRKIRQLRPQIVVLDIALLDGNGLQVLEAVRKSRRSLPRIIMLTNFAHEAYRAKCLALGAEYFFDKSAQFEEAVEVIRELSRNSSAEPDRTHRSQTRRDRNACKRPKKAKPLLSDLCVLGVFAVYFLVSSGHTRSLFTLASVASPSGHG